MDDLEQKDRETIELLREKVPGLNLLLLPSCASMTLPFIQLIARVLDDFPEVRFCTLFGSAARGRMRAESDLDIAVAGPHPLTIEDRLRLCLALSSTLGREVDLIDLQNVSGLILEQALCTGEIVKNADRDLYANLIKRLWYSQADMMPYVRRILEERSKRWLQ